MQFLASAFLFILIQHAYTLDNGLGRTPQMGWNSWNHYHCNINEIVIRQTADAMVASGLAAAGYQYVNVDDCWQRSRDANGTIQADPIAFPSGMPALVDYVHSRKLKFGLYSDRGYKTCAGRPGSLGYEVKDANTYASWGVDYLKLDSCNTNGTPPAVEYSIMRDALNATGRPIFYSLCGGVDVSDMWPPSVGNSWRTTTDIQNYWSSMISNIEANDAFADKAGPGGWNDPDMLEVGNGGMTVVEYISHFSLWAITKAPLIIGCDLTRINTTITSILTNPEVIAVNQDPLGVQGRRVIATTSASPNASGLVLVQKCLQAGTSVDLRRQQWIYNSTDGSIRSVFDGRCLSIANCSQTEAPVVLNECHIDDPKAQCHGANQQWIAGTSNQTITSRMNQYCLDVYQKWGPSVQSHICNQPDDEKWKLNSTDGTIRSANNGRCLMTSPELEVWAGPLTGGSKAVVLLNRGDLDSTPITFNWSDIGLPVDHAASIRDLWTRKDLGRFTGRYTSPNIDSHAVMMFNITLAK